ncbi:MAG TPA: hypothetical protein QGH28_01500 [Chloroflexota bacterium]|nr:hypothetical protein [Chloroflexota bacterium]
MLDPHLEEQVASAMRETPSGVLVALPPDTIETVLANIQAAIQQTVTVVDSRSSSVPSRSARGSAT